MTKWIASALLITGSMLAQTADVKQLGVKSEKEGKAVNDVFSAAEPAARVSAADALLSQFANTQFKALALYIATISSEDLGNWEKTVIYGDRALEADPKSYGTMLVLARGYASHTREFDLDKEEKLGKTDKYAKRALELLKNAPKIQPQLTDEQWGAQLKAFASEAYEAMGLAATIRKKYDDAIANYKLALEATPGNQNVLTRIAQANLDGKKYDEAVKSADVVLAQANLNPQVKAIAENIKKRAADAAKAAKN